MLYLIQNLLVIHRTVALLGMLLVCVRTASRKKEKWELYRVARFNKRFPECFTRKNRKKTQVL